ncbi:glycoside hydrolase family 43 protein [Polyporus arcularius HHB13444]|uniref:Arabinan endo-1,5-alpha-L-arabinosidase n=1 Tax=Polyporus arcularius HHB13444 TaxID=1314778 RepID=A0A5C3PNE6_9APHY|nr:glycoside hydrolase family 43 protein [Polyporus arcularius HHB13444]
MKFSILASLLSLSALAWAVPNPLPGGSSTVVRDPTIIYNPSSKKYFVFSTGENIQIFTSPSLTGPWTRNGSVLPNCSKINLAGNCALWAPDVSFVNGQYVLYYSVSSLGSQNSAIGVATSKTAEPGSWTDWGAVVTSTPGGVYNAIDPNLINANGLHLTFGSYWDGIFQIPLTNITTQASPPPGTHVAGNSGRAAEGGFVYKPPSSQYYFLFFSDGVTPLNGSTTRPPAGQEYKVLVGRSTSPTGPFVGQLGHALTENLNPPTGTLVLGSHDNVYAPGGQSVYHDPVSGRDVIVYHYVPNDAFGGPSYLGINYLDFSSGWPVVVS